MSIAAIPDNPLDFQNGNNIRIAIGGLAICKFTNGVSNIRFLRHLPDHQLKLRIVRKLTSGEIVGQLDYTIGNEQKSISISGAEPSTGYTYKPTTYLEYDLKMMLDLQFLHGHKLTEKVGPNVDALTNMTINNCLFYTAAITDAKFDLVKNNSTIKLARRFGEVLGGYMKVAPDKELTINIAGLFGSPIKLPMKVGTTDYLYELQFNNSCFKADGLPCEPPVTPGPTDFLKVYDILEDIVRPFDQFDLRKIHDQTHKGLDTGACLPVVEDPCLNCS